MSKFQAYVAVYLILRNKNNVLLLQRQNTGFDDGKWSLPAGHVEANESAISAMIRESVEEIDIHFIPSELSLVYTLHRKSGERTYIDLWFEAQLNHHQPKNAEPHKCQALCWFNINSLPENTQSFVKHVLSHYHTQHYGDIGID